MSDSLSKYFLSPLAYTFVIMLAFASGYCSSVSLQTTRRDIFEHMFDFVWTEWTLLLFLVFCSFIFFFVREQVIERDDEGEKSDEPMNKDRKTLHLILAIIFFGLVITYLVITQFQPLSISVVLLLLSISFTWYLSISDSIKGDENISSETHFCRAVLIPAITICTIYFVIGWALASGESNWCYWIYAGFFTILSHVFYRHKINLPKTLILYLSIPVLLAVAHTISKSIGIELLSVGPELFLAMLWSLLLGIFEVSKRVHLSESDEFLQLRPESKGFYMSGANWSTIVFMHVSIVLILFETSWPIIGFCCFLILFSIIWVNLKGKNLKYFHTLSIGSGVLVAFLFCLAFGLSNKYPANIPEQYSTLSGSLVSLLGVFVTVSFVLFPDKYRKMGNSYNNAGYYLSQINCYMLVSPIMIFILSITFVGVGLEQLFNGVITTSTLWKLDVMLLIALIEVVVLFIFLLLTIDNTDQRNNAT